MFLEAVQKNYGKASEHMLDQSVNVFESLLPIHEPARDRECALGRVTQREGVLIAKRPAKLIDHGLLLLAVFAGEADFLREQLKAFQIAEETNAVHPEADNEVAPLRDRAPAARPPGDNVSRFGLSHAVTLSSLAMMNSAATSGTIASPYPRSLRTRLATPTPLNLHGVNS
jgi:hypothetical protein